MPLLLLKTRVSREDAAATPRCVPRSVPSFPFPVSPASFFAEHVYSLRPHILKLRTIYEEFTRNVVNDSCHHPLGTGVLFRAKATTPTLSKRGVIRRAVQGVAGSVVQLVSPALPFFSARQESQPLRLTSPCPRLAPVARLHRPIAERENESE